MPGDNLQSIEEILDKLEENCDLRAALCLKPEYDHCLPDYTLDEVQSREMNLSNRLNDMPNGVYRHIVGFIFNVQHGLLMYDIRHFDLRRLKPLATPRFVRLEEDILLYRQILESRDDLINSYPNEGDFDLLNSMMERFEEAYPEIMQVQSEESDMTVQSFEGAIIGPIIYQPKLCIKSIRREYEHLHYYKTFFRKYLFVRGVISVFWLHLLNHDQGGLYSWFTNFELIHYIILGIILYFLAEVMGCLYSYIGSHLPKYQFDEQTWFFIKRTDMTCLSLGVGVPEYMLKFLIIYIIWFKLCAYTDNEFIHYLFYFVIFYRYGFRRLFT